MSLLKVTQDRWDEIFEAGANYDGEQLFIDFDRKTIIGKPLAFIEDLNVVYYSKEFVANLKANTPFNFKKSLPEVTGKTFQMYSYPLE